MKKRLAENLKLKKVNMYLKTNLFNKKKKTNRNNFHLKEKMKF